MSRESIVGGVTAGGTRRAATHYGRRLEEGAHSSEYQVSQDVWKQETTFRYDQLPTATLDELHQRIPAGARVVGVVIRVLETVTATTALNVNFGLSEPDGTVISANGLATAAIADLTAGKFIDGAGALVGSDVGLTAAGQLVVAADVDDLTAGEISITIEYEKPSDRQQIMNG